jgi:hypothetical protein
VTENFEDSAFIISKGVSEHLIAKLRGVSLNKLTESIRKGLSLVI